MEPAKLILIAVDDEICTISKWAPGSGLRPDRDPNIMFNNGNIEARRCAGEAGGDITP
jgi:hypothetical protein